MASRQEHCNDCVIALGEPFGQVHDWLDEFFPTLGPAHRSVRHHVGGIEEVRGMWGDRAAEAAAIHIRKDYYGKIPEDQDGGPRRDGEQERRRIQQRKARDPTKFSLHPEGFRPGPGALHGDGDGNDRKV